ncbi:MAG: hypothetical protein ISS19_15960 [Bacteroidales bacterium]|nr:hypothetical protein [Bacteroidales bacterium]
MKIAKYSFGTGDRFCHQGKAQLEAIIKANEQGIPLVPVWNKSNREHLIVHTKPEQTRKEADESVAALGWTGEYYVDADHINMGNVDPFIDSSDFFTIDVADYIGKKAEEDEISDFINSCKPYLGELSIPGVDEQFSISEYLVESIADNFLFAIKEAGKIYRHIRREKGSDDFIPEISMDEVEDPQTPVEMFLILKAIANEGIPVQTIAPKFTGRFNKGVDYVGALLQFEKEFEQDLLVIDFAIKEFGLPENLKLSVHSGSDKFSIYPILGRLIKKYDKGIHIKTAGTTWLEEVIGLALSEGQGLKIAKEIYSSALARKDELCQPYATVINIDYSRLPLPDEVNTWTGVQFANALRHIPDHPDYNLHFRQLIHVGYKVASDMGDKYYTALKENAEIIAENVKKNIFDRHIKRLFLL